jgi:hypothetical protein
MISGLVYSDSKSISMALWIELYGLAVTWNDCELMILWMCATGMTWTTNMWAKSTSKCKKEYCESL